MPIEHEEIFVALAIPFGRDEVKTRQQAGRSLSYVTARTVMCRLDDVLGPSNWWDSYIPGEHSVLCTLTIRLPDGSTISKQDAGGMAGMSDQGDDEKSGYSDAFKRAAVKFGVGRHLYGDGVPAFVRAAIGGGEPQRQQHSAPPPRQQPPPQQRRDDYGRDDYGRDERPAPQQQRAPQRSGGGNGQYNGPPRSGRALFAWTKEQEQQTGVELLAYLNKFGKLQDWPGRMVDWDDEQVRLAHAEAVRKLQGGGDDRNHGPDPNESYETAVAGPPPGDDGDGIPF